MASGKINAFNLGANGVDLVKSPLHVPDGAFRTLQNAEFSNDLAQGGVKKRGSLQKLNTVALAGAVRAMVNVPLPLQTTRLLMVALLDDGTMTPATWLSSTDGAAFTDLFAASLGRFATDRQPAATVLIRRLTARTINYLRSMYYPGDDDPDLDMAPLDVWSPAGQGYELLRVPQNPTTTGNAIGIFDFIAINGLLYFTVWDFGGTAPNHKGRVFELDPIRGGVTEIGNRWGSDTDELTKGFPVCLANYQGYLFAGTFGVAGNNQGAVYRIHVGVDAAWTLDYTLTLHNGYAMSMAVYDGELYIATDSDTLGTAIIQKRAADGTVTTSFTAPDAGISHFQGLHVFNGKLYVAWWAPAATSKSIIYVYDGATWAISRNVGVSDSALGMPANPIEFEDNLYWGFRDGANGFLLKLTPLGVWSKPIAADYIDGALGIYTPDA